MYFGLEAPERASLTAAATSWRLHLLSVGRTTTRWTGVSSGPQGRTGLLARRWAACQVQPPEERVETFITEDSLVIPSGPAEPSLTFA